MSIGELVGRSNLHFAHSLGDCVQGEEEDRMRLAWHILSGWQMTAMQHHANPQRTVLVVADQTNSRIVALRSEILAFGVALEIAIRLYQIPYAFWEATPGLQPYDMSANDAGGNEIAVEARGRINRRHMQSAIAQVHQKFPMANFSRSAGVIFFPRTSNRGRLSDIIVLDPDGKAGRHPPSSRYRKLLRHYVPFFNAQGGPVRSFGSRLQEISVSPEHEFRAYLQRGDSILSGDSVRRGHAGFDWNGIHYVGTFFKDIAWPKWLTGFARPGSNGVFFWGLASHVVDALQSGRVETLNFANDPAQIKRVRATMSIILADMTALIWAPTLEELEKAEDAQIPSPQPNRTE